MRKAEYVDKRVLRKKLWDMFQDSYETTENGDFVDEEVSGFVAEVLLVMDQFPTSDVFPSADHLAAPTSGRPIFDPDKAEEHITKMYEQYRDDANKRFIQDNEGRSKERQIFSPEYYKFLGMQLATSEILEFFARFDFPREEHE